MGSRRGGAEWGQVLHCHIGKLISEYFGTNHIIPELTNETGRGNKGRKQRGRNLRDPHEI